MDYNWLLTTIAQSSAALVGISAGFLILRISVFMNYKLSFSEQLLKCVSESTETLESLDPKDFKKNDLDKILEKFFEKIVRIESYTRPIFPYSMGIGLVGIIWLIIVLGISVKQISEFIVISSDVQSIKWNFFIGLVILALYLVIEIINAAYNDFINEWIYKKIKSIKPKKDKPKEN